MNCWDLGIFENEAAVDWLYDFEVNDFRLIDRTLAGVAAMQPVDYLDVDEACEVLTAAECVAAAGGQPAEQLPEKITDWVAANQPIRLKGDYVRMAQTAVARIRNQSKLKNKWTGPAEAAQWETAVANLQTRLEQIVAI